MFSNVGLVILDTFDMETEYAGPNRICAYMRLRNIPTNFVQISVNKTTDLRAELSKIPEEYNLVGFSIFSTNAKYIYN